jgi:hypothetical protein
MSNDDRAKEIRDEMEQLRRDLDISVDEASATARQWSDWRYVVRRYPWATVALAAAVGYLIVPGRPRVISPDADTLIALAKKHKLVLGEEPKKPTASLPGKLMALVLAAAGRTAMAYMTEQVKNAAVGGKVGFADREKFDTGQRVPK